MSALTKVFPRNSSRTSTHAISVPVTALTAATPIETRIVNLKAATASLLEIAFQKPSRPLSVLADTSAARGSNTMMLSHTSERLSSGGRNRTRRRVNGSLACRDPKGLLDLRHAAVVGVEELVVHGRPA